MNISDFKESFSAANPPASLSACQAALWYDAKGDWNAAHDLIDDMEDKQSAWVHAYLHRKEGDAGNASYWYRKAGKAPSRLSLEEEWEELVKAF